jgi:hypothetical protein
MFSRRKFPATAGTMAVGISLGGATGAKNDPSGFLKPDDLDPNVLPVKGSILVDTKKCRGPDARLGRFV